MSESVFNITLRFNPFCLCLPHISCAKVEKCDHALFLSLSLSLSLSLVLDLLVARPDTLLKSKAVEE